MPVAAERPELDQVGLLWGVVALALLALAPFGSFLTLGLPACPLKTLTGVPCPGCGTTRAALLLSKLEVFEAFVHYPLQTLGWIGLIGGGLVALILTLMRIPLPGLPKRLPTRSVVAIGLVVAANWAYAIATGV